MFLAPTEGDVRTKTSEELVEEDRDRDRECVCVCRGVWGGGGGGKGWIRETREREVYIEVFSLFVSLEERV